MGSVEFEAFGLTGFEKSVKVGRLNESQRFQIPLECCGPLQRLLGLEEIVR